MSISSIILILFIIVASLHQVTAVFQHLLMQLSILKVLGRDALNGIGVKVVHIVRVHR